MKNIKIFLKCSEIIEFIKLVLANPNIKAFQYNWKYLFSSFTYREENMYMHFYYKIYFLRVPKWRNMELEW